MKHTWYLATAGVMAGVVLALVLGVDPVSRQWTDGARAVCGDGIDDSEDCDDGNTDNGDGCSSACAVETGWTCDASFPSVCSETCGDGAIVGDEACDDGDTDAGDGCSATCTVENGYECTGEPSVCAETCGNGEDDGEDCDDGNTTAEDGCSATCTVEHGWSCDVSFPSVCETTCNDSLIGGDEECDDGGTDADDGCSATCTVEDGWTCAGEPSVCQQCGNGLVEGTEECDDDNTDDGDGCSSACAEESGWTCAGEPSVCETTCGDNIKAGAEACDFGDTDTGDGCSATCTLECGDGTVDTDNSDPVGYVETCDDGNSDGGDGCGPVCKLEVGYRCSGTPSVCRLNTGGSGMNYNPTTAPYERQELRKQPAPISESEAFRQYRELFATSLSTNVVNLILGNVEWPACGGRSRRAPEIPVRPLEQPSRGHVLTHIAARLCMTSNQNIVPFKDFDPRAPYAQAVRALFGEGVAIGGFDEKGEIQQRLEADRPISFLELTSLITQLRKRGFIQWVLEE